MKQRGLLTRIKDLNLMFCWFCIIFPQIFVVANPWKPHWTGQTTFKHPVEVSKYLDPDFIEFTDDEVLFNVNCPCFGERQQNLATLFMEAHKKFKFPNGVIYLHNGDNIPLFPKTIPENRQYHAVFDIRLKDRYYQNAGPDFSAVSWGSAQIGNYVNETKLIIEASKKKPLYDQVGWQGNQYNHPKRQILMDIGQQHPHIFNFTHFTNDLFNTNSPLYVTHHELAERFAYIVDVEGVGYSARLKYLLFTNRPLFLVYREFVVYFEVDLHPFVHYIPVKPDLSDLVEKFKWAKEHPAKAAKIAQNAFDYAVANLTHEVSNLLLI